MLAPEQRPLKPPSPLQPKNGPKTPISRPQRRWRFQLGLSLREQRRCRFHPRLALREQRRRRFQLPPSPARKGDGGFNPTRARASKGDDGFTREISDARGRWRGLAVQRANAQATYQQPGAASVESAGGRRRDRRAWLRRPWAAAGPGRASRRRAERSSRRGRRAGGPPPTGTPSSPAPQQDQTAPGTPAAPQATTRGADGSRAAGHRVNAPSQTSATRRH